MDVQLEAEKSRLAPDFIGAGPWINSEPLSVEDIIVRKNVKILMVAFLTYTRAKCIRFLSTLNDWWKKYHFSNAWWKKHHDQRFLIVGVIEPEFSFEKDWSYVARFIEENKIEWPVLLDPDSTLSKAYGCVELPDVYIIDGTGLIRHHFSGEGKEIQAEIAIQQMIREIDPSAEIPQIQQKVPKLECFPTSPDLYCGYLKGNLGNPSGFHRDDISRYEDPHVYEEGFIHLNGLWECKPESVRHARNTTNLQDHIAFAYRGVEVYAVIGPAEESDEFQVFVMLDGGPVPGKMAGKDLVLEHGWSWFTVTEPRAYEIIKDKEYGFHALRFTSNSDKFEAFDFTIGGCLVK
jgi:hypothetical protein